MAREAAAATVLLALLAAAVVAAGPEGDVLLAFRGTLRGPHGGPPEPLSQWDTSPGTGPCRGGEALWYGVACHHINGQVLGLRLEYLGLEGPAPDINALGALPGLRALSLSNNNLTGPFPDASRLTSLKMLYLSRNKLAGDIPDDAFAQMTQLRKLYLSDNAFTGPIPSSITSPRLLVLQLSKNRFEGPLPDFDQQDLQFIDVSNNNLSGPIPMGLRRFNASAFEGNNGLCGPPLNVPCPQAPPHVSPPPSSAPPS